MAKSLKIGAVACPAIVNDSGQNITTIATWAKQAAKLQVQLLLFPELSITGYYMRESQLQTLQAESAICQALTQLAREVNLILAVGMAWLDSTTGEKYLAHGLWLPSGEYYIYRKTHLGEREKKLYMPGNVLPVFALPQVAVGIEMCLEQHFPEISQTLALRGAQLLLCPHAVPRLTPQERRDRWYISLRARAYDNCVYVLATNQVGDNGQGLEYSGGILLVDPSGQVIAEDFSGKPAMITADIKLSQVMAARTTPQGMCRRFYATSRRTELYE
jgi:predicted amidohydrolase